MAVPEETVRGECCKKMGDEDSGVLVAVECDP